MAMASSPSLLLLLLLLAFLPSPSLAHKSVPSSSPPSASLSNGYYFNTCPQLESIIQNKVTVWLNRDLTLSGSLLRLHFHDCMATGCDGSILLADPKGRSTEMYSEFSRGLRGFRVVENIKSAVEAQCPGIVSCADILTTIARDVVLQTGGPFWFVPFGRKDSLSSNIADAAKVPRQDMDANALAQAFQGLGLSIFDLVTLSGAHTIGRSHCFSFTGRNADGANSRINRTYAPTLENALKQGPRTFVFNDPITEYIFDSQYFTNLRNNMGLFKSDQSLYYDNNITRSMIDSFLTQPGMWENQFAVSIVNMGNIGVLTGPNQGEIRKVCSTRNSH